MKRMVTTMVQNLNTGEEQTFTLPPREALISAAIMADKRSCDLTNEFVRERYGKKILVGKNTASIDTTAGVLGVRH